MKEYYAYNSGGSREGVEFSLLPLNSRTPYVDGMYYPDQKVLLLLARDAKERFQMVPQIDSYGEIVRERVMSPKASAPVTKERMERVLMQSNFEYYLTTEQDIRWFCENFVENGDVIMASYNKVETKEKEAVVETA